MSNITMDDTFLLSGDSGQCNGDPDSIQVGAFQERSLVAGPGERAVLWVSGCRRRCPGCFNPDLFAFDIGYRVSVDTLAERILSIKGIAGVSYSGGEPFEHAVPLANLSRRIKAAGLSVLSYTGYRLEALRKLPERFGALLDEVDILIDGEYRQDLYGPFRWRGSENQTVHFLSTHPPEPHCDLGKIHEIQITLSDDSMFLTGFPSATDEQELAAILLRKGIVLKKVLNG